MKITECKVGQKVQSIRNPFNPQYIITEVFKTVITVEALDHYEWVGGKKIMHAYKSQRPSIFKLLEDV